MTFSSRFLPLPRCAYGCLWMTWALSQAPCVTEQISWQRSSSKTKYSWARAAQACHSLGIRKRKLLSQYSFFIYKRKGVLFVHCVLLRWQTFGRSWPSPCGWFAALRSLFAKCVCAALHILPVSPAQPPASLPQSSATCRKRCPRGWSRFLCEKEHLLILQTLPRSVSKPPLI